MKKLFTMSLLALLGFATSADAQGYRRWDFTHWSAQTIANLAADAAASSTIGWSDIEKKADAGEGKVAPEATAGKCYWLQEEQSGELTANGVTITETQGLLFGSTYCNNRSLAIAVDYPSTSLGEYAGPQYLWLGGGGKNMVCFTIPNVRVGQKMTFTVESHKPSDARGVELYVGAINAANKIGESFKPTTLDTYTWEEWELPEAGTLNDDGETVDVIVYNTSGCHIYNIEIGTADQKSKAAFLYEGDLESSLAYSFLSAGENYDLEPIAVTGALDFDQLTAYDAIVISSTVANADAIASLQAIQPFVPTLCLNPAVYAAWGVGTVTATDQQFLNVKMASHNLFRDLTLIEDPDNPEVVGLPLTSSMGYQALTLGGRFADDAVLATVMGSDELVAIHGHSLNRNAYIYIPYTDENLADAATPEILTNAISVLANTKVKVAQAPAPGISLEYKDRLTVVTLKSTVAGAEVFYTLDGSEPTAESTLYTEPFEITSEGVTVKAVARGEGFLMSDVASQTIVLKSQAPTPVISSDSEVDGNTVTISCDLADATIYYNYSGSKEVKQSSVYTGPIELKKSRTVYAFAVAEGYINSELAELRVVVGDRVERTNILAHMDANKDEYYALGNQRNSSTSYYFSWANDKAGYSYWNTEDGVSEETVTDPETGEESTVTTYSVLNPEEEIDFQNGWMIRSRGQLVIWEGLNTGNDIGDTSMRNPATVDDIDPDFPITNNFVNLADKNTQPDGVAFPYNAYIVSTQKFQGPFDIVANIGNGNGSDNSIFYIVLQTSKDGNQWDSEWQTAGDTIVIENGYRLYHNFSRSYNGSDEVYVRAYLAGGNSKAQFYDIYIANNPNEEGGEENGDVNGDGDVDVADISSILTVMSGDYSKFTKEQADVNGDGNVDVADISTVLTIMANN
ncbi:MAG: chitobiase/beta-hexosaminidase C-terminal domain-containing protein [Prevotella sp.]|nr:chitobiase/beta-hexosaminidase C-terminal domain-containing protein [Prevotella sp.]